MHELHSSCLRYPPKGTRDALLRGLAACLPDSASLTPRYPYTDKDLDEMIAAPERFLDAVEFEKETIQ
jgi:hypothetical protein